jgi:hypothetical protein
MQSGQVVMSGGASLLLAAVQNFSHGAQPAAGALRKQRVRRHCVQRCTQRRKRSTQLHQLCVAEDRLLHAP